MEGESVECPDRPEKQKTRAVEEMIQLRTESQITIEASVDTGFEFMAAEECRDKFGEDFHVLKERGSIIFNIEKSRYSEVLKMRSVDNLNLVLSYVPNIGLTGTKSAEDLEVAKKQAHSPDWDFWLTVWKELSGFEGIVKPTPEQYTAANERATKDKEAEKLRQAERQKKYKERQEKNALKRAKRKAKADQLRAEREAARRANTGVKTSEAKIADCSSTFKKLDVTEDPDFNEEGGQPSSSPVTKNVVEENASLSSGQKEDNQDLKSDQGTLSEVLEGKVSGTELSLEDDSAHRDLPVPDSIQKDDVSSLSVTLLKAVEPEVEAVVNDDESKGDADASDAEEIQSLPDYERDTEIEIDADVPPGERVMRFRATCFRVGKHSFGSMEAAREFGGELQEKFNWVVDLVNFNAEIILSIFKDSAQVSIALTKRSLHRRNISFFGPTTLRSTVCHNLLRLSDLKPGDIVLDPLAGGGSIPIEGAMSFPGMFHLGGDNHHKAMSRFYSNVRCLQEDLGKGLPVGSVFWDAKRLPLCEASIDVIVSDLPFGVRVGSRTGNRNLYRRVLLEMARVVRPGTGRAILLTEDRKSFSLALVNTMGLWWQTRVMSANIGGLDAAVFTLRRTAKLRPDEADLAAAAQNKDQGNWRDGQQHFGGHRGGHGQRGWGRGGGRGRGSSYPRGKPSGRNNNWRNNKKSDEPKSQE